MQILRKHIFVVLPLVLLATGSTFAAPQTGSDVPLLVETEWVEGNLGSSRLLLVDFGRSYQDYLGGHIPGAVFLDRKVVWDTVDGLNGMLPPEDSVVQAFREAGIDSEGTVVIYDAAAGLWASRLFWALEYFGHGDVHILNGGWTAWQQQGNRIHTGADKKPRGTFTPKIRPDLLATKEWLLQNFDDQNTVVVDARSKKEYTGKDARSKRGGHIPGSVNIDWVLNITGDESRTFLSEIELAEMYDSLDVSKDREAVTLCQTGVRAAHSYFVLRLLGYPKVRMYDGSWEEWGNASETPIQAGE